MSLLSAFGSNEIVQERLAREYDFSADSATTSFVADQESGYDLDRGNFSAFGAINGKQAGQFDGGSDRIDTTSWSNISVPYEIWVVGQFITVTNDFQYMLDGGNNEAGFADNSSKNLEVYDGGHNYFDVSADTKLHIFNLQNTSTEWTLRLDGTEYPSGSTSGDTLTGFTVGGRGNANNEGSNVLMGTVLVYDDLLSENQRSQNDNVLTDRWL